jgi:hypothetical protein
MTYLEEPPEQSRQFLRIAFSGERDVLMVQMSSGIS